MSVGFGDVQTNRKVDGMNNFRIGFSNLSENIPFARIVREGLEQSIQQHDDIDLIVRDNDLDNTKAEANVEEFIRQQVDLMMIYHVDSRFNKQLGMKRLNHNIPTIAIDIPIPLASYFGVNNQQAGQLAGETLGKWVVDHWQSQVDKILVMTESRVVDIVQLRLERALESFKQYVKFTDNDVMYMNGGNERSVAHETVKDTLLHWKQYEHIALLGLNNDMIFGVLDAAKELDMSDQFVTIGQGSREDLGEESYSGFLGMVNLYPEKYGSRLIDLALQIKKGQSIPKENFIEHHIIYQTG